MKLKTQSCSLWPDSLMDPFNRTFCSRLTCKIANDASCWLKCWMRLFFSYKTKSIVNSSSIFRDQKIFHRKFCLAFFFARARLNWLARSGARQPIEAWLILETLWIDFKLGHTFKILFQSMILWWLTVARLREVCLCGIGKLSHHMQIL